MRITTPKNLAEVSTEFEPIPAGTYTVRCTQVEQKTGKTSNKPYLNFTFEIQDAPFTGRLLWGMGSLAENALFGLKNILEGLNVAFDEDGFDTEDAIGQECLVEVIQDEYEGKVNNKIEKYIAA